MNEEQEAFNAAFLSANGHHTLAEMANEWIRGLSGVMFRAGYKAKQFEALPVGGALDAERAAFEIVAQNLEIYTCNFERFTEKTAAHELEVWPESKVSIGDYRGSELRACWLIWLAARTKQADTSGWEPAIVYGPSKSVFWGGHTTTEEEDTAAPQLVLISYADWYEACRRLNGPQQAGAGQAVIGFVPKSQTARIGVVPIAVLEVTAEKTQHFDTALYTAPPASAAPVDPDGERYRYIKSQMETGAVTAQLPLERSFYWVGTYVRGSNLDNVDGDIDNAMIEFPMVPK